MRWTFLTWRLKIDFRQLWRSHCVRFLCPHMPAWRMFLALFAYANQLSFFGFHHFFHLCPRFCVWQERIFAWQNENISSFGKKISNLYSTECPSYVAYDLSPAIFDSIETISFLNVIIIIEVCSSFIWFQSWALLIISMVLECSEMNFLTSSARRDNVWWLYSRNFYLFHHESWYAWITYNWLVVNVRHVWIIYFGKSF